jgi:GT2 family glycosyltransferase/glycosyltransferase involved in cell wall biosynthesis
MNDASKRIDIVIPVFRGDAAVRRCLESVLASEASSLADIVVVDDASPEPAIADYLQTLATANKVTLLQHELNQGFVASVNEAAALHPERDFVILNADTEVAGDWLRRLQHHAARNDAVATVTPFSNNATIASFPKLVQSNALPRGETTTNLHALFSSVNHQSAVDIPTAIGFCTLIRRAAWREARGFDTVFGRGYGEEVDFCCKLSANGWQHLLAADVFVFHEGGVSFGAEAHDRKVAAQAIVDERHPGFGDSVQRWIEADPALPFRLAADMARVNRRAGPRWLFVSHAYGGGVQQHIDDLAALIRDELDGVVWLLQPRDEHSVRLTWCGEDSDLDIPIAHDQLSTALPPLAAELGIQRLHFHHFAGLPISVLQLPNALGLPFDVTFHDFHTVCPQTHFITRDGDFCGRPDVDSCESCVAERPDPWDLGIRDWRATFDDWLSRAERLIHPNSSVRDIVSEYFPELSGEVWPHPEGSLAEFAGHAERSLSRRKVALIGSMSDVKGLHRLKALAELSLSGTEPVEFVVIGPTLAPLGPGAPSNVVVTGQYDAAELPNLLARERPDSILFLSVVPETYNFALSAALATGLPIVALDAGAIGERLEGVEGMSVLPLGASTEQVLDAVIAVESIYQLRDVKRSRDSNTQAGSAYVAAYSEPLTHLNSSSLDVEQVAATMLSLREAAQPVIQTERGISELLEQAIDCRLSEATVQLRQQAIQNERQLAERNAHVVAAEREVLHHQTVIQQLQTAHVDETNDLRQRVSDLSDAHQEVTGELSDLQAIHQSQSEHLSERESLIMILADRIREIESSTTWRLTAPLRWSLDRARRAVARVKRWAEWCRRALVFVRYHYGHGGMPALREAIGRRLRQRQASHEHAVAAPAVDDLPPPDETITFAACDTPKVSIVIPTYGEHAVTRQCLASLSMSDPNVPCEVIVVDDAFREPLDTGSLRVEGVRLIRNKENQGFLRSCNQAMKSARGDYLLLLNNDTLVHPGAVEALLSTFEDHGAAGAVCAQLRFADGSLQEAGGIVWRDGSAWNWGRGDDPCDPRFSYPREVDYGSAAALMVERTLWERIGGFDECFAPAYYEDTDFCFAVRAAGRQVIYQPKAVVTHLEGISHGTDTGAGMKSHQVINQRRFAEKWRAVLDGHRANGVNPMLERDRGARARILWVEACMLTPDQDSGSLRTIRLLRILAQMGCKVTFIADNMDGAEPYRSKLASEGIEVIHSPYFKSVGHYLKQHGEDFDVVTLCRHYIAIQYIQAVRDVNPSAKIWFDTIDLHYLRSRRQYELDGKKSTSERAELAYREEMIVIKHSDVTLVVSDAEVAEIAREEPNARVEVLSNVHEPQLQVPPRKGRVGVMFVGGFQHPPNVDAVEFFALQIWPIYRAAVPDAEAFIIGSKMPDSLRRLGEKHGLTMLGFVPDLEFYYRQCVMAIAPLRYGAGVKGKVNQALSYGIPMVGTNVSVEGMNVQAGEHILIADTPEEFAQSMIRLNADDAAWNVLSEAGPESVRAQFSADTARQQLQNILSEIVES